ncbi:MAG: flagellar biosynthesis protein FlhB [Ignavibacteria bacterium]|nr:flagellar biosynthesis protein FlhB [Ignavibacteria bacterium]
MAEADGQEKTEQATGKRLSDSRAKGNVAKSIEVNSFVVFTAGTMLVYMMRNRIADSVKQLTVFIFGSLDKFQLSTESLRIYSVSGIGYFFSIVMPILLGIMVLAFLGSVAQVGFVFSTEALRPKFNKLNPANIKKILFSSRSIIEMLKAFAKLTLVGLFAYNLISDAIKNSMEMARYSIEDILGFMVETSFSFVWKMAIFYAILAAADFGYQKFKHKKDLMMTKQEIKEENKQSDGDPLIKSKIRSKQLMMARNRMMKDVPKADVVITNPTHVAIALKYDVGTRTAPRVVAKGLDLVAQKIKEIAKEHDVPMHEDVQLARALYKYCEIGDQIPESYFRAVAQILAYVYQQKHGRSKKYIV